MALAPFLAFLALLAVGAAQEDAEVYSGDATAASGPLDLSAGDLSACQLKDLPAHLSAFYAHLPASMFDAAQHCGRCVRVTPLEAGPSDAASYTLVVAGPCESCGDTALDVSAEALEALSGSALGSTTVEWQFVSCDEQADLAPVDLAELATASGSGDSGGGGGGGKKKRKRVKPADAAAAAEAEPAADAADAEAEGAPPPPTPSRRLLRRR